MTDPFAPEINLDTAAAAKRLGVKRELSRESSHARDRTALLQVRPSCPLHTG